MNQINDDIKDFRKKLQEEVRAKRKKMNETRDNKRKKKNKILNIQQLLSDKQHFNT